MSNERITLRTQGIVALIVFVIFIGLAIKSRTAAEETGYTAPERHSMERVTQKALADASRAERNRDKLIALYDGEPDGAPVETYRKGSAAK